MDTNERSDNDHRRREILQTVAVVFSTGWIGKEIVVGDGAQLLADYRALVDSSYTSSTERREFFTDVFNSPLSFTIDAGLNHPEYGGFSHHEDNATVVSGLLNLIDDLGQVDLVTPEHAQLDSIDRDILSIGSGTSNLLAQYQFGRLDDAPRAPEADGLTDRLRWLIDVDFDSKATCKRYLKRNLETLPTPENLNRLFDGFPWSRFDNNRSIWDRPTVPVFDALSESHYYPRTDADGFLKTDYLVLNKLPNVMSQKALHSGKLFVQFSGAHGAGTRGFLRVLSDEKLMREIREHAARTDYFQILLEVTLSHDDELKQTKIVDVEKPDGPDSWFHEVDSV